MTMATHRAHPLAAWLRKIPMPSKVRVDGKSVLSVGTGKSRWKDIIDSVVHQGGQSIEALNSDGEVLRTTTIEIEASPEEVQATKKSESRDVELARIIMEAGDRGASRHAEAYAVAFAEMTGLVRIVSDRMAGLETAWQTTLENRAAEMLRPTEGENGDEAGGLIAKVVELAMARQQRTTAAAVVKSEAVKSAVKAVVSKRKK